MTLLRLALLAITIALTCGSMHAGELDPAAVTYTLLPDKVKWESIPGFPGAEKRAVMVGDPSKPGFYAVIDKMAARQSVQPSALSSARSFYYGLEGNLVGRQRHDIRPR